MASVYRNPLYGVTESVIFAPTEDALILHHGHRFRWIRQLLPPLHPPHTLRHLQHPRKLSGSPLRFL